MIETYQLPNNFFVLVLGVKYTRGGGSLMQLAELQFRESEESRQRLMGVVGRRFQSYSVLLSP